MSFREVVLAVQGQREKDKFYKDLIRRATFIIGSSGMNAKAIITKFNKLWPDGETVDVPTIRERAYEQLRKFKEQEKRQSDEQKVKQLLDGRRVKDSS